MKAKKYWILLVAAAVCGTALWVAKVYAYDDDEAQKKVLAMKRNTLVGIKGVLVVIEGFGDYKENYAGLTKQMLKTDVELKLRQYGLKVYTEEQWLKDVRAPYLYVDVLPLELTNGVNTIYCIDIQLKQKVFLLTTPPRGCLGVTCWEGTGLLGIIPTEEFSDKIRQIVKDEVEKFVNDYLAANPKHSANPISK